MSRLLKEASVYDLEREEKFTNIVPWRRHIRSISAQDKHLWSDNWFTLGLLCLEVRIQSQLQETRVMVSGSYATSNAIEPASLIASGSNSSRRGQRSKGKKVLSLKFELSSCAKHLVMAAHSDVLFIIPPCWLKNEGYDGRKFRSATVQPVLYFLRIGTSSSYFSVIFNRSLVCTQSTLFPPCLSAWKFFYLVEI